MLYRIYTENKPETKQGCIDIVSAQFDGFTVFEGIGYWQGKAENCLVFEVDTNYDIGTVRIVAQAIKEYNEQECVLIECLQSHKEFI